MAEEAPGPVEVENVDWRRLVWLLSLPCETFLGIPSHDIEFISAYFRLTDGLVIGSHITVSLRINWLHECFHTNGVNGRPLRSLKRREIFCDFDCEVVLIVLEALPRCSKLTHARFSFCGNEPLAAERLLFFLCERLTFTPALASLNIDITFPLRKPKPYRERSVKDVPEDATIREFSPILLVRNPTLKTLRIHSDCHTFDCEAAEQIALFLRENPGLTSLDLRLLVTSPEFLLDDVWLLIRPLSKGDKNAQPWHKVINQTLRALELKNSEVSNQTLRTLVLKFFFWETDWPVNLAKHVRDSGALVKSSFFMCPFLHKLSFSLVRRSIDDETEDILSLSFARQKIQDYLNMSLTMLSKYLGVGSEAVHVVANTSCNSDGQVELCILKCDERASVSTVAHETEILNLDTLLWTILRCANSDVLVLKNPSPTAVPPYINFFLDSSGYKPTTIKLFCTAEGEDLALQRARLGAVVESSVKRYPGCKLRVEITHKDMSLISAGKNSVDMWRLFRDLKGFACLQSFIVDKWELRWVGGSLRPLFNGAVICTKVIAATAEYEVKVKMSRR